MPSGGARSRALFCSHVTGHLAPVSKRDNERSEVKGTYQVAIIENSSKLSSNQEEYRICCKNIVFFRLIAEQTHFRLMTATASEDAGEYHAFPNQQHLITSTCCVFSQFGIEFVHRSDRVGRRYIEANISMDKKYVVHTANTILLQLGVEDANTLALLETRSLYEDFCVDDTGDDAYLGDGLYVTADGRLVER
jgi:hypothetical protein